MSTLRSPFALLLLAAMTAGAVAQQQAPAAPTASAPAMPMDCAKPLARHDHGAERGFPTLQTKSSACAPSASASAAAKEKAKPVHDHGKFHKNQ